MSLLAEKRCKKPSFAVESRASRKKQNVCCACRLQDLCSSHPESWARIFQGMSLTLYNSVKVQCCHSDVMIDQSRSLKRPNLLRPTINHINVSMLTPSVRHDFCHQEAATTKQRKVRRGARSRNPRVPASADPFNFLPVLHESFPGRPRKEGQASGESILLLRLAFQLLFRATTCAASVVARVVRRKIRK